MAEIHKFPKKSKAKATAEISIEPPYLLSGWDGEPIDVLVTLLDQMNRLSDPAVHARTRTEPLTLFHVVMDACNALVDVINGLIFYCRDTNTQAGQMQADSLYSMGHTLTRFMAKVDEALPSEYIIKSVRTYAYDFLAEYGTSALLASFQADAHQALIQYQSLFIRTKLDSREALLKALRKNLDDSMKDYRLDSHNYQQVIKDLASIQRAMTKITGKLP